MIISFNTVKFVLSTYILHINIIEYYFLWQINEIFNMMYNKHYFIEYLFKTNLDVVT